LNAAPSIFREMTLR